MDTVICISVHPRYVHIQCDMIVSHASRLRISHSWLGLSLGLIIVRAVVLLRTAYK